MTTAAEVHAALQEVFDPELPVLTISDLGVLRDVHVEAGRITVTITPTYSGCPAMDEIRADIRTVLGTHGWDDVDVRTELSPAWTTDWMSERGRDALRRHGIAPPGRSGPVLVALGRRPSVDCPHCGSVSTEELSRFGSTSCKALWRCLSCREPFDVFKDH